MYAYSYNCFYTLAYRTELSKCMYKNKHCGDYIPTSYQSIE